MPEEKVKKLFINSYEQYLKEKNASDILLHRYAGFFEACWRIIGDERSGILPVKREIKTRKFLFWTWKKEITESYLQCIFRISKELYLDLLK